MSKVLSQKFGISSNSFPWAVGVKKGPKPHKKMSSLDLVEMAKELGAGILQIDDNLPLENLPWESMISLKRRINELGISIRIGTKGVDHENLHKFLEIAQFLGSTMVKIVPLKKGKRMLMKDLEKSLGEVLPEYDKAEVMILLENHESHKAKAYKNLMERMDHPRLRLCLDLANALGAMENPEQVLYELGSWCGSFHYKDVEVIPSRTLMGYTVEGRPAGKGHIRLPWAMKHLREQGNEPAPILKLWTPWQGTLDETLVLERKWVSDSVKYVQSLVK